MHHETMNGIVILIALGAGSLWLAWRLRIPSILVLLAVGFVAGPLTGLFRPDQVLGSLTFPFVSLAAAIVLFEGGLSASWEEIRGVAKPVRRLIFIGAMAPRGVVAAAVSSLFSLELVNAGYREASILMPVTFTVIALTVLVSGLSAVPLVNRLGLAQHEPQGVMILGANRVGCLLAQALNQYGVRVLNIDSDPAKVNEARRFGLVAKKGEILSRRLLRDLDLDEIGHFVALTSNDDLNTLAVARFRRLFGASNVHQIRPSTSLGHPQPHYASELQAAKVAAGVPLDKLEALVKASAVTMAIPAREATNLDAVRERLGRDSVPLFVVDDEKRVTFVHVDEPWPTSGKLVVLTPP
ncbi:MAG: NAD-binding protein [Polyangiales bacterium]